MRNEVGFDARGRRLRAALAAVLLASASASAAEMKRSMLCESREAAIVGYYNNEPGRPEGAVKRSTALERQDTNSQWRIDPLPSGTEVLITRYSSTFQQIEEPEVWTLESDPAAIGWLLKAKRSGGRSPETITITSATLHFVYSSQHVNPFYTQAPAVTVAKGEASGPMRRSLKVMSRPGDVAHSVLGGSAYEAAAWRAVQRAAFMAVTINGLYHLVW